MQVFTRSMLYAKWKVTVAVTIIIKVTLWKLSLLFLCMKGLKITSQGQYISFPLLICVVQIILNKWFLAGRPARTYIQQLCEDTGCCPEDLPRVMNDREEWREMVRDIRATNDMMIDFKVSKSFYFSSATHIANVCHFSLSLSLSLSLSPSLSISVPFS